MRHRARRAGSLIPASRLGGTRTEDPPSGGLGAALPQSRLAHVAAVSFIAARAAPSAGFLITLAGGVALARAGERLGARRGFGASVAAMLQSVAMLGPARLGVPLTQAITAPVIGRLQARGRGFVPQLAVCALVRAAHNSVATAFFIWVIVGGLDAYAGSYDAILSSLPLIPSGGEAALPVTALGILVWTAAASTVQVAVYRRGLRHWSGHWSGHRGAGGGEPPTADPPVAADTPSRFDPRAVALAAAVAFAVLLVSTATVVLAAVAAWLVLSTLAARRLDRRVLPAGLALAAILGLSAFGFALVGGLGLEIASRRAARATLLVLVATWLRAVAGSDGLREVARRGLAKLARIPSLPEASRVLDQLGSAPRLLPAGRALFDALGPARKRPVPLLDAVLGWVERESARFRPAPSELQPRVGLHLRDGLLVALAAAPVLVALGGA